MKKVIVILAGIATAILLTDTFNPALSARISAAISGYRMGSRGKAVYEIQQGLMRLGYYKGSINGTFDSTTLSAVKVFQSAKGLKADGIVKTRTLKTIGESIMVAANKNAEKSQSSGKDVSLLARAINGEARGEPYIGAVAVGGVIMNRTRDPRFPNTVSGVIYQPGAFTAITDGQINANMEPQATKAARDALNGWDPSGGAVYYFNPATSTNKWIWSRPLIKVIGKHRFCK